MEKETRLPALIAPLVSVPGGLGLTPQYRSDEVDNPDNIFLTLKDVAKYLNISKPTLYAKGITKLPKLRKGNGERYVYRLSDIDRWLGWQGKKEAV